MAASNHAQLQQIADALTRDALAVPVIFTAQEFSATITTLRMVANSMASASDLSAVETFMLIQIQGAVSAMETCRDDAIAAARAAR